MESHVRQQSGSQYADGDHTPPPRQLPGSRPRTRPAVWPKLVRDVSGQVYLAED